MSTKSASTLVVRERASFASRVIQLGLPLLLIGVVAAIAYVLGVSHANHSQGVALVSDSAPKRTVTPPVSPQPVADKTAVDAVSTRNEAQLKRLEAAFAAERKSLQQEIDKLRADLLIQIDQRDKLGVTLNQLDHQLLIDKTAYKELAAALDDSSREIARLRQEVDFYRNIVSPNENDQGLQVSGFRLLPSVDEGVWSLSLVLVQTEQHNADMEGELSIEVEVKQGAVQKIVEAESLGADYDSATRFKYYHRVRSQIVIPPEFEPIRIGIIFNPLGKNSPVLSQWYAWPPANTG